MNRYLAVFILSLYVVAINCASIESESESPKVIEKGDRYKRQPFPGVFPGAFPGVFQAPIQGGFPGAFPQQGQAAYPSQGQAAYPSQGQAAYPGLVQAQAQAPAPAPAIPFPGAFPNAFPGAFPGPFPGGYPGLVPPIAFPDMQYDYYDWVCTETECQLCNILTSECCDPEIDINCFMPDSCFNNPCLSGGTCIQTTTIAGQRDFTCVCLPGLTGKYCQLTSNIPPMLFAPPMPFPQPAPAPFPQPAPAPAPAVQVARPSQPQYGQPAVQVQQRPAPVAQPQYAQPALQAQQQQRPAPVKTQQSGPSYSG